MDVLLEKPKEIIIASTQEVAQLRQLLKSMGSLLDVDVDGTSSIDSQLSVDQKIKAIIGQSALPFSNGDWRMSNYRSAIRLDMLEIQLQQAFIQIQSLGDAIRAGFDAVDAKFDVIYALLTAARELEAATVLELQNKLDLQEAKLDLSEAAVEQLELEQQELAARVALTEALAQHLSAEQQASSAAQLALEARQTASELAQVYLSSQQQHISAQQELLQAQQLQDEVKLKQAQDRADAAYAQAMSAQQAAATADLHALAAQTTATTAASSAADAKSAALLAQQGVLQVNASLTTATLRVDALVSTVNSVQNSLANATQLATATQERVTALENKGRVLLGVATPASTGLLAINGTISVPVSWAKPFADTNYAETFVRVTGGAALLGLNLSVLTGSKTTTGFTILITNVGTLAVSIPAGVLDITVVHA